MKNFALLLIAISIFTSCTTAPKNEEQKENKHAIEGTWKLISGTLIEKNDTTVTDYTKDKSFIKVINDTHFAFMGHDLTKGKDSAFYSSGGGSYTLQGDQYTEHLDYCDDRGWEGHSFPFTVSVSNDTLIQTGIEKIDSLGINRLNIEKYIRVKN